MGETSVGPIAGDKTTARETLEYIGGLVVIGALLGTAFGLLIGWDAGIRVGAGFVIAGVALRLLMFWFKRSGRIYTDRATPVLPGQGGTSTEHRRNHVICLDGTWNAPTDIPTNVLRLFDALREDSQQIKRYYPGVGTRDLSKGRSAVIKKSVTKSGLGGASGIGRFRAPGILLRAYFDFAKAYRPGDRIFIFGFSRGAATARALANHICKTHGLSDWVEIDFMKSQIEADPVLHLRVPTEAPKYRPPIEFLGLWDTVAAMPARNDIEPVKFDLSIPPLVHDVCHLVAIHEGRGTFDVKLIDQDERVEEIWFPGWHSNVGGGSEDSRLSNIALRYMITRAEGAGARFAKAPETIECELKEGEDLANALWDPHYWRKLGAAGGHREIRVQGEGKRGAVPKIHESAYAFKQLYPRAYDPPPLPDDPTRVEIVSGYGSRVRLERAPVGNGLSPSRDTSATP